MSGALSRDPAEAQRAALIADALTGLSAARKTLPCKWLYDAEGTRLFEAITDLPEYYPTRTEVGILDQHGPEIARAVDDYARQQNSATMLTSLGDDVERERDVLESLLSRRLSGLIVAPIGTDYSWLKRWKAHTPIVFVDVLYRIPAELIRCMSCILEQACSRTRIPAHNSWAETAAMRPFRTDRDDTLSACNRYSPSASVRFASAPLPDSRQ